MLPSQVIVASFKCSPTLPSAEPGHRSCRSTARSCSCWRRSLGLDFVGVFERTCALLAEQAGLDGLGLLGIQPSPSHCLQRSPSASRSIGVRHLLQSLATAPLAGPSSSLRRGDASPAASLSKDRHGTCARRVTPYLPGCCMTRFCALQQADAAPVSSRPGYQSAECI